MKTLNTQNKTSSQEIDWELVKQFEKGLEDLKAGNYEQIR